MHRLALLIAGLTCLTACGEQPSQPSAPLIVGGGEVGTFDPIAAYTLALVANDTQLRCSAVLIAPQVALTAAHCLDVGSEVRFELRYGVSAKEGVEIAITKTLPHPDFQNLGPNGRKMQNDLAILELARAVPGMRPVKLAPAEAVVEPYQTPLLIAGFGVRDSKTQAVGRLMATHTYLSYVSS